jgi:transposase-like protein
LLPKWKQRYKVDKSQHSLEPNDLAAVQAELRRVKHELAIVSQERDILKKAIAIFSKEASNGTGS